jgi:hypothetical protein
MLYRVLPTSFDFYQFETLRRRNLLRPQGKSEYVYNNSHFTSIYHMKVSQQYETTFKNYTSIIKNSSISNHNPLDEMYLTIKWVNNHKD